MEATFIGNPADEKDAATSIRMFDVLFPLNVPVELPETLTPAQVKKLAGNNHFVLDGYEAEAEVKPTSNGSIGTDASAENVSAAAVSTIARAKPRRAKAVG